MMEERTVSDENGLLHTPAAPAVADDESDEILADCGECVCGAKPEAENDPPPTS